MQINITRVNSYEWRIDKGTQECMKVPVTIFADDVLIEKMKQDMTLRQATNVACLPGVQESIYVLPDGHQGYGFPIGGIAATAIDEGGVVSPGGIGYDINCGVRLLRTNLDYKDVKPKLAQLVEELHRNVPSGVGSEGKVKLTSQQLDQVLGEGVAWAVDKGFGWKEDMNHMEQHGSWELADPSKVSPIAKQRGASQLGTLGAGNHFLEIQVVDKIFDSQIAKAIGVDHEGQVMVMVHTGSRGLGHQVASDYLQIMERAMKKYNIQLPDRELAAVPFESREGQDYFHAMASGANFAWTNRQLITHWTRESFGRVFGVDPEKLDLNIVYDVAHNIAKIEEYVIEGKRKKVLVHRKGATRAFPPGSPEIPADHRNIGQIVLIPGSMGTASYVMAGIPEGRRTWFTAPHGAGRWMSREAAVRNYPANVVVETLAEKGIVVRAATRRVVAEEAPGAYKDVDRVAKVAHEVKIAKLVMRLRPIGVTKG
ncbi:MAG: RtcB family protein [Saccharolobus sp.]|uniref:tRNA-splicing ligase RtcB n=2 Tax=Saccharolobus shibatae TaxID=2286 RepID=A0A8F5GXV7_9CREN|nr:RtcB family protein [Saccharolobus shibatae]MCH4815097.1 RtcB family protein [Saccharolobus shibatae]QXJ29637.1 RNA-2',3'-PO4:RNA-5'-OH ligase [Saccharolobus shibatae B12]QXJ32867.1 RNA-2',3'-PO4:RNA-5'-OH ligase [Saccharolobus shibatae]QXJ35998.1 RNA-2',3'-PO4:RNA-5'-OH ligase [Saccharolobus shibatae]